MIILFFVSLIRPAPEEEQENVENDIKLKSIEDDDPGSWEENFKSHHDSKPRGPEAIALDFTFPQADVLFGWCFLIYTIYLIVNMYLLFRYSGACRFVYLEINCWQ